MKRIFSLLFLIILSVATAIAQEAAKKPEPKPLTETQVLEVAEYQKELKLLETQAAMLKERIEKTRAQLESLVKSYFIEAGLSPKDYEVALKVISADPPVIGFVPRPPMEKPKEPAKEPVKE